MTDVEVVKFEPRELVACDELLMADYMLKQFCDLVVNRQVERNESLIKPETDLSHISGKGPVLSAAKQLVLIRSCLSDVIYSLHCLGVWCSMRTVKLYLTEFARMFDRKESPPGELICATATILNCIYGRLEELTNRMRANSDASGIDFLGSTRQLKTLLHYIKDLEPPSEKSWPICIVHVRKKVIAKVIALWLNQLASENQEYAFIKPNYIVGSSRKHRNRMTVDSFDHHHEASIKDFRSGKCNTLVISTVEDRCTDMLKCNLVVLFDHPNRFNDFLRAKANCRVDSSKFVILLNELQDKNIEETVLRYMNMEKIFNSSNKRDVLEPEENALLRKLEQTYPPFPKEARNPATVFRSMSIINKYCAKLPSDSFTKLSPEWTTKEVETEEGKRYYCEVRLPINSPVRQAIIGPIAPTKAISMKLAAFAACKVLHSAGEIDDNLLPIKKESMKLLTPWINSKVSMRPRARGATKGQSIGSTKHRQYYRKRIAEVFSGPLVTEGLDCYLYQFKMVLSCPIPDEQNRRGRRIIDPSETSRNYAIICTSRLPKICSFPVFTRSGEVMISVELVKDHFRLKSSQIEDLRVFHEYTFSKVLRLEKYPTVFDPKNSPFTVLLAPVIDSSGAADGSAEVDWSFVSKIVNSNDELVSPGVRQRRQFKFQHDDYVDAVVIPWYRLTDRQQFAYYVAEICTDMNPQSPFPDESSGYETFIDYYKSKYDIEIFNKDQPVLDVDHTSARLNLLTPRYVNRKGRTLPSSTAKTRKESRESLVQKQLLIPELCTIHPFPASFWRKAVCLPAIFYRLNSLYLAEELRREVAQQIRVGFVEPERNFEWPKLDFGWSLKDVIKLQTIEEEDEEDGVQEQRVQSPLEVKKEKKLEAETERSDSLKQDGSDFVIDHFDPSQYDIPDISLDSPPDEWMNIKLISSGTGGTNITGWDQPIEQRDLFLHHNNEITWEDCEMEFDGEFSEKVGGMRCGSPSSFEPTFVISKSGDRKNMFAGLPGKHVQFEPSHRNGARQVNSQIDDDDYDDDDYDYDEDDDDDSYDFNSANQRQSQRINPMNKTNNPAFDSDSSWSLTDEEEDDMAKCTAVWQEDKSKQQSLIRELFVPYFKKAGTDHGNLEAAYIELLKNSDNPDNTIQLIQKLKICYVKEMQDAHHIKIMAETLSKDVSYIIDDQKSVLTRWYNLVKELEQRVNQTLIDNPDLFRDNDVELVAVDDKLTDYNLEMQPTFGELLPNRDATTNWSSEEWKNIKFDPTRDEIHSGGPGPSVILQALTMSNASDGINLERLETVGDSFLKYSITAYLYCKHPTMHEGKLSYLRSNEISNANLYRLGREKSLGELMSATKFEPNDNWLPPGYSITDSNQTSGAQNGGNKKEIDKALAEVPYDLLRQHSIPDKSIADCVEALIGAYLTASGSRAALLFMRWLGLGVMPSTFDLEADLNQKDAGEKTIWRWLDVPPSPLICAPPTCDPQAPKNLHHPSSDELRRAALEELDRHYRSSSMDKFEEEIQYSFKDKAYLVQAFTHNSYYENHVTDCHQRLEFLGDALLDYLITRYLFEDPRCHSPGTLTDLRSALVNNTFFASLAVKYNFHKYLKFISDDLFHVIDGFVKKFKFESKDTITKGYTLLINEGESEYAEDIEVPKALGDVFESVAGAIYLDSGMSLDQVWQVYFKMMKPEIEYFSSHVPKSPIRELLESMPQNVRFSPSELAPDRKHRVTAEVFGLGRFTGVGRNKHSAKSTAAKRALRMLAIKRRASGSEGQSKPVRDVTLRLQKQES